MISDDLIFLPHFYSHHDKTNLLLWGFWQKALEDLWNACKDYLSRLTGFLLVCMFGHNVDEIREPVSQTLHVWRKSIVLEATTKLTPMHVWIDLPKFLHLYLPSLVFENVTLRAKYCNNPFRFYFWMYDLIFYFILFIYLFIFDKYKKGNKWTHLGKSNVCISSGNIILSHNFLT